MVIRVPAPLAGDVLDSNLLGSDREWGRQVVWRAVGGQQPALVDPDWSELETHPAALG